LSFNGDAIVSRNPHLTAAIPVKRLPAVAEAGILRIRTDNLLGSVPVHRAADSNSGWSLDKPGEVSIIDDRIYRSAPGSVRFQSFEKNTAGMGRLIRTVEVQPNQTYRLGCWFKSDNLEAGSDVLLHVRSAAGRILMNKFVNPPATGDWFQAETGFNTLGYDKIKIYIGIWEGSTGRLWVDDVELSLAGPLNVVRGDRTPVRVSSGDDDLYTEGSDFEEIVDPLPLSKRKIGWDAAEHAGMFPSLGGELEVFPVGEGRTQVTFTCHYRPPLKAIGAIADTVYLHRVADECLDKFFNRLVESLE